MSREQQVRDALARFLAAVRTATDTHLDTLSHELIAVLRADAPSGGEGAAQLVEAVRRLDEATTLRGVLDALAAGTADHVTRSAVLLVDRAVARPYRQAGFPPERVPAEVRAAESAGVARAIAAQAATLVRAGDDPHAPPFMQIPAGDVALLMPVVVAQQVVALVDAEGPAAGMATPGWAALVESLTRHASAKLENVTSKRTVEVLTGG
ncbi:MAG: hypothetical protein IT184_07325 [Acidobacteria bacterium]|nr:hypothetical protein [Acidobacteriota bacterium]